MVVKRQSSSTAVQVYMAGCSTSAAPRASLGKPLSSCSAHHGPSDPASPVPVPPHPPRTPPGLRTPQESFPTPLRLTPHLP